MRILTVIVIWALVTVLLLPGAVDYDLYSTDSWRVAIDDPIPDPFTIVAWYYLDDLTGTSSPRAWEASSDGDFMALIWHDGDYFEWRRRAATSGLSQWTTDASSLSSGAWFHLAVAHDGGSGCTNDPTIWINGSSVNVTANLTAPIGVCKTSVGSYIGVANADWAGRAINGKVAQWAMYDGTLTTPQVQSLAAGFTPDKVAPEKLWRYMPMTGEAVELSSGASITSVGSPTIVPGPRVFQ